MLFLHKCQITMFSVFLCLCFQYNAFAAVGNNFVVKNAKIGVLLLFRRPVFPKIQYFGPYFQQLFATITQNYRLLKTQYFLVKNGKIGILLLTRHPVFQKILVFGLNFHHLFATITQKYRVLKTHYIINYIYTKFRKNPTIISI